MEILQQTTGYMSSTVSYFLLSIVTILLVVHYYLENTHVFRLGKKLPGPKMYPIIGNAYISYNVHPKDVLKIILEHDKFGNVVRAFLGPKLYIFLKDPRDVETILSSHVHIDKSSDYKFFKPWLGNGLLISQGETWRSHRKIIAPTFHASILKSFVPFFYEKSKELVAHLRKEVGKEFDCHDYMGAVTVETLVRTVMGVKELDEKEERKYKTGLSYASAVMRLCDILHQRQYNIGLRLDWLFRFSRFRKEHEENLNSVHDFADRVIHARQGEISKKGTWKTGEKSAATEKSAKAAKKNSGVTTYNEMPYVRDDLDDIDDNDTGEKKRLPFLDHLLDVANSSSKLSNNEVADQVNTIMFEGHDTITAASSFALCVLGVRQDIQKRVCEELNEIFGDSDRECTVQDTLEMKYLERVIMETLRVYPPVPVISRELTEDVKIFTGDYVLPKGSNVLIPMWAIHRHPDYYSNPEVFDPDNFLPEKMRNRHYYSFIPFSAGPRSCVGRKYATLKLKVLLSTILRNYKILSDVPEDKYQLRVDIILKRSDGFKIRIEPREKISESLQQ